MSALFTNFSFVLGLAWAALIIGYNVTQLYKRFVNDENAVFIYSVYWTNPFKVKPDDEQGVDDIKIDWWLPLAIVHGTALAFVSAFWFLATPAALLIGAALAHRQFKRIMRKVRGIEESLGTAVSREAKHHKGK